MSRSLTAEPRRKGLFEPHYWTRAANQTPYASLIPLLFPEVFSTSSLVDRAGLLRGRVDSDTDPRLLRLDQQQLPRDILSSWLMRGGGAQDILDDTQLYTAVCSFLDNSSDHVLPKSANANDPGVEQSWITLMDVRHRLRRTFTSNTRGRPSNQSREPPGIDPIDPEELVDNLDAMAAAAFGNVTDSWFLPFPPSDETVEIQNMYFYLQEIEPSPLIDSVPPPAILGACV
ncbi:hypothetical protein B0H15DRAFT_1001510 [Mycena belliarum]|uniref:Uncharacterized protein n=1 Tax=Mycena belliarum TaxID=1033014 RepID=A0AAD6XGV6_9AGAR|nr:hypothetical protein B0H15DRAFT_1001510 [Mycena belliae]